MADVNPFEQPPVFEETQVITYLDLGAIRNGYAFQYRDTPWYNVKRKFMLRVGVGVCNELLHWLHHGKPVDGVKCQEGLNHAS